VALLGFLQALDGAFLLLKITFVFDFRFHGLKFVAKSGGKNPVIGRWSSVLGRNVWSEEV
jgi:hypothetical protein